MCHNDEVRTVLNFIRGRMSKQVLRYAYDKHRNDISYAGLGNASNQENGCEDSKGGLAYIYSNASDASAETSLEDVMLKTSIPQDIDTLFDFDGVDSIDVSELLRSIASLRFIGDKGKSSEQLALKSVMSGLSNICNRHEIFLESLINVVKYSRDYPEMFMKYVNALC